MPVICSQNNVGLAHLDERTIVGWMHGDEPDNAQTVTDPKTGRRGYGGPVPPPRIVEDYQRLRAIDPSRPVMLNLGQGVANDEWYGRGAGANLDDYQTYVKGGDIVSFDVYPVAGLDKPDGGRLLVVCRQGRRSSGQVDRGQEDHLELHRMQSDQQREGQSHAGPGPGRSLDVADSRLEGPDLLRPPVQAKDSTSMPCWTMPRCSPLSRRSTGRSTNWHRCSMAPP